MVVGDELMAAGFFCAYLTVHCKKSTVHIIGSRNLCIKTDIIIKYTLERTIHSVYVGSTVCAERNEVEKT